MVATADILDASLLLLAKYATIRGTTPPWRATKEDQAKARKDFIRQSGLSGTVLVYLSHIVLIAFAGIELRAIFSPSAALSIPYSPDGFTGPVAAQSWAHSPSLRNGFRIALIVSIIGGVLRVVCFRQLGRFFTFDLAVQKEQKVRTSELVRLP